VVEGCNRYPQPGDIPTEQFESLESLELVGDVGGLLRVIQPRKQTGGIFSIPFPSLRELRCVIRDVDPPIHVLEEVLMERKEAGYGVKVARVAGRFRKCSSEEVERLNRFVDVLVID
jgi:hypothetical protein